MATIGVRELYFAILNKDDETGVEYEPPERIKGLMNITLDPQISEGKLYGDDTLTESYSQISEVNVEFGVNDLSDEQRAKLFGIAMNEDGVVEEGRDNDIPYIALAFKSKKSNGKFRYYWLYKGKLSYSQEQFEGTKDSIEYQTPTVNGVFQCREYDGKWRAKTDEDNTGYTPEIGQNWFVKVYEKPAAIGG
ncbi:major tail protein [Maledivibacter halophilus]|uniref:Phage major tail protein, phi13 family n=1 Tax=Maledivibacter halophilus TaxID=36842 RepID=A0A1T5KGC9_9FIRM|nr:major tail protein [Maledivibacter halophilus]SKC62505.1 phage major tail protein, phi13 family [Maledivibacter halophilus]